jgi:hypothetical protein
VQWQPLSHPSLCRVLVSREKRQGNKIALSNMTFPSFDVLRFPRIIQISPLCFILFTSFLVALYSFFHATDKFID